MPRRLSVISRRNVLKTWKRQRFTAAAVKVFFRQAMVDKSLSTERHLTLAQSFDLANVSRKLDAVAHSSLALRIKATFLLFPSSSTTSGKYGGILRLFSLYVASNIKTSPNRSKFLNISGD